MDLIKELRKAFKVVKRESTNYRVGPCPECNGYDNLSVNIFGLKVPPGTFNCWKCGFSGQWNELAEQVGMRKINVENDLTSNSQRLLDYQK